MNDSAASNTPESKLIDVLMITYNRPTYTRKALSALLESCDETMRVWVWHNGDHQPTLDVVKALSTHARFHHLEHSRENKKLREPTNWFWQNADGAYLSKVDDDCMLPKGWGQTLRAALESNPRLGFIGCWRFYEQDFVPEAAEHKITDLNGGHQLLQNPWVQGSGYLMRREFQQQAGLLQDEESWTEYCVRGALNGWQGGWRYPFIHEEHMDDPRSPHCEIRNDEEFLQQRPLSAIEDNVTTLQQWGKRVQYMAYLVQKADPDPRRHHGWRRKVDNALKRARRALGIREPWQV